MQRDDLYGQLLGSLDDHLIARDAGEAEAPKADKGTVSADEARESFAAFPFFVAPHYWMTAPHIKLLAKELEEFERAVVAGESPRLIVLMPPRHSKSENVSVYFPAWLLGRNPDRRVILCAYGDSLAAGFSRRGRNILDEDGPAVFGVRVADDSSAANRWDIAGRRGGMIAAGIGGPITGKGADVLIIDDPIKNQEEALSPTHRDKVWDWWRATARTRLEPGGGAIICLTHWHEGDLAGRLRRESEDNGADPDVDQWRVLRLPAIAEENDLLGRRPGHALWPARYDEAALAKTKRALGTFWWSALYQQDPRPREGGMFQRHWFEIVQAAPAGLQYVRYWDRAATKAQAGSDPDWTAGVKLGRANNGLYYITDVRRIRGTPRECEAVIKQTTELDGREVRSYMEQEPGSSSKDTIDYYTRILAGFAFRGDRPTGSKEIRAEPLSAQAEAGNVKLVAGTWVQDFLDEIEVFPHGAHDDQVDGASGAFNKLHRSARQPAKDQVAFPKKKTRASEVRW
ncbi:MAG: phage terminase large subunit [Candidatus Desulforudaceae bacterium]